MVPYFNEWLLFKEYINDMKVPSEKPKKTYKGYLGGKYYNYKEVVV